jgi:hypothetical protein
MPAPRRPNTIAATAARRRRGQETMADKLRRAGWDVRAPEHFPSRAVAGITTDAGVPTLRREAEQSLWLHRAVAAKVVTDPAAALALAGRNLAKRRGVHGRANKWLDHWQHLLDQGVDAVLHVMTSEEPYAVELRQNTPFAGILTEEERRAVLNAFRAHWRQHQAVSA